MLVAVKLTKMTQEKANKIFDTELGQQLLSIYVTSDDKPHIRYKEAMAHVNYMIDEKGFDFNDTITEWFPE
jgi:hypothetical protein